MPAFGIGNELWGCGGNMSAQYASDVTKRYSTFLKVPAGKTLVRIAAGANGGDYNWTEVTMREAAKQLDALSLHYYTLPQGGWPPKADPVNFGETEWADTLAATWKMDELIAGHAKIMDKYDPQKRVFLAVDEWGTWYAPDPGTNPGFLRQQNTLRDALVASVNLDIFAKHADRVRMTAIAQMVNVLQAMILTEGRKMVLTPTYHVFEMYKPWQDATVLPIDIATPWYNKDRFVVPAVSGSAVRSRDGKVHVGLSNLDPNQPNMVTVKLDGLNVATVTGRVLTAQAINAHNTFDAPDTVRPAPFTGARMSGGTLTVALPPKSVVVLDLQ